MSREQRLSLILILILITVNLAAFIPSMSGGFIWDDRMLITENPDLQKPGFLNRFLRTPFGQFQGLDENSQRMGRTGQFYRPVSSLSYWLDLQIWGLNPAAFHLTNILLHTANVILLLFLLFRLGLPRLASFFGALLFSLFPPHFENVAWISGRTDLLSFFFAALSGLAFLRFLQRKNRGVPAAAALFFGLSLLAKESAVLLPVIYGLILFRRGFSGRRIFVFSLPFAAAAAAWFVLRSISLAGASFESLGTSVSDFLAAAGFYAARLIFPFNLSFTVDASQIFSRPLFIGMGAAFTVLGAAAGIMLFKKNPPYERLWLAAAALWAFLLPPLIIIFSETTVSLLAWRFLYLPSAVFLGAAAHSIFRIRGKYLAAAAVVLLSAFYAAELYPKSRAFGLPEKEFWLSIENIDREDILARFNIGVHNLDRDEIRALRIFEKILQEEEHPLFSRFQIRIYEELAAFYTFNGRTDRARIYFEKIQQLQPFPSQHYYVTYASFLALDGKREQGEKIIREMLNLFPRNHLILLHAAKFYILIEEYDRAVVLLERDYAYFPTEEIRELLAAVRGIRERGDDAQSLQHLP